MYSLLLMSEPSRAWKQTRCSFILWPPNRNKRCIPGFTDGARVISNYRALMARALGTVSWKSNVNYRSQMLFSRPSDQGYCEGRNPNRCAFIIFRFSDLDLLSAEGSKPGPATEGNVMLAFEVCGRTCAKIG